MVSYINCTAELKTLTDICCTSTNALHVINSIPKDQKSFCPDINLGKYLVKRPAGIWYYGMDPAWFEIFSHEKS